MTVWVWAIDERDALEAAAEGWGFSSEAEAAICRETSALSDKFAYRTNPVTGLLEATCMFKIKVEKVEVFVPVIQPGAGHETGHEKGRTDVL
jgi:hypothetical protein